MKGNTKVKIMIISDLHGSFEWTKKAITQFDTLNADYLFILGDVLYHGPRNALPDGHSPKDVAALLNQYADKIIAVRGNCEAEVDQVMLKFSCMNNYTLFVDNGRRLFLTHGHLFDETSLPFALPPDSIFLSGHTHIWRLLEKDGTICCNPGSVALPKAATPQTGLLHTYALYTPNCISVFDLADTAAPPLKTLAI
ncbi:phosphoesterase [Spirochaetia bacterium]|nr:phosphoesterase [Spirochaetia bacterium]